MPGSTSASPQAPDEGTGSGAGEDVECQDDSCGENAYCKVHIS